MSNCLPLPEIFNFNFKKNLNAISALVLCSFQNFDLSILKMKHLILLSQKIHDFNLASQNKDI